MPEDRSRGLASPGRAARLRRAATPVADRADHSKNPPLARYLAREMRWRAVELELGAHANESFGQQAEVLGSPIRGLSV